MKKLLLGIGVLVVAGLVWSGFFYNKDAIAISGCCKNLQGNVWRRVHDDFGQCKQENKVDKDDIFEKHGTYWWDISC